MSNYPDTPGITFEYRFQGDGSPPTVTKYMPNGDVEVGDTSTTATENKESTCTPTNKPTSTPTLDPSPPPSIHIDIGKTKVYIAGPLTNPDPAKQEENAVKAIKAGIELVKLGYSPYIPHLYHYFDIIANSTDTDTTDTDTTATDSTATDSTDIDTTATSPLPSSPVFTWKDYMELGMQWLAECEALLYLGSSPGADIELCWAKELGIEVFYSIEELTEFEF